MLFSIRHFEKFNKWAISIQPPTVLSFHARMDGTDSNTWGESFWPHSGLGTSLWLSAGFPEGYGLTYLGRTTLRSASDRVVPSRGPFREPTMVDPPGPKLSSSITPRHYCTPSESWPEQTPRGTNQVTRPVWVPGPQLRPGLASMLALLVINKILVVPVK